LSVGAQAGILDTQRSLWRVARRASEENMTKQSLARAIDHVERAIALCDRLGETAAAAHLQLGLDTLERVPRPLLLPTDVSERE